MTKPVTDACPPGVQMKRLHPAMDPAHALKARTC